MHALILYTVLLSIAMFVTIKILNRGARNYMTIIAKITERLMMGKRK